MKLLYLFIIGLVGDFSSVKTMEVIEHIYDRKGTMIVKEKKLVEYDSNERIIKETLWVPNTEIIGETIRYFYDTDGKLIKRESVLRDSFSTQTSFKYCEGIPQPCEMKKINSNNQVVLFIRWKHDDKGQRVQETWYNPIDTTTIKTVVENEFDENGNLVASNSFYKGNLMNREEFKYDSKNRPIQHIEIEYEAFISETQITYTETEAIHKKFYKTEERGTYLSSIQVFDQKKDLIRDELYATDGTILTSTSHEYEYKDSLLMTHEKYENGRLKSRTTHNYTFF